MNHFIDICWAVFAAVWLVLAFTVKRVKERQNWRGRAATVLFLTITFLLLAGRIPWGSLNSRVWPFESSLWVLGCSLTFLGLVVSIWSRLSLGANWSATVTYRQGHELILSGPYRFVRHPMYTGFLLMIAGTSVALGNISGLASLVICFLGTWWKLRKEEALLTKHFPDAYRRYELRTKALIPFLL